MNKITVKLDKIESSWPQRARVRCPKPFSDAPFIAEQLDFLPEWIPFGDHPDFLSLPDSDRSTLLSIAWLLYNQATIDIEYQLVIPFCLQTMSSTTKFRDNYQWRQLLFQTITDESYHVQLTEHASQVTRMNRQLQSIQLPISFVMQTLAKYKSKFSCQWEKDLITLATCIVTEIVIGEHLSVVAKSTDTRLQEMTRAVTKTHMMDESIHGNIFKQILREYYLDFNQKQKSFLNQNLPNVVAWFCSSKLSAWTNIFEQVNLTKGKDILNDCHREHAPTLDYDLTELADIAEEFGLNDLEDQIMETLKEAS